MSMQADAPSGFENGLVNSADLSDFSPDLMRTYLDKKGLDHIIPSDDLWKFFEKKVFVSFDGAKERYMPTTLGILMFSKDTQIMIKTEVRYGCAVNTGRDLRFPSGDARGPPVIH